MTTFSKQTVGSFVAGMLLLAIVASPFSAVAAQYQPQTTNELIAYLYGRIAQLMEIKALLERGGSSAQPSNQPSFSLVAVATHRATEVEDTTAVLRGEVLLYGDTSAEAWFEYGQDSDFLDQKTRQRNVRTVYDRALRVEVTRLEPDERYYFRIAAVDDNGSVYYGPVFQFRTDEERR